MEKRVILRCGYRKFEDLADEEREHRAATAALGIEMRNVRNRHVVGEIERIVPIHVPVQPGRSEAQSTKSPRVPINAFGAKRELYPIAKEVTVMIEVMNIYFEASLLNFLQERF
jgi:hypothetical protein